MASEFQETVTLNRRNYDELVGEARRADESRAQDRALIEDAVVRVVGPAPKVIGPEWNEWYAKAEAVREKLRVVRRVEEVP